MQLTLARTLLLLCGLGGLAAVAACGDATSISSVAPTPPGFPGPRPSRPPPDLNDGAPSCPSEPPDEGATCDSQSSFAACQYGPDVRMSCNDTFTCESGRWMRTAATCETSCPSRFEDIPIGAACAEDRVACSYEEGTCGCVWEPGGSDGGAAADAGDPDGGHVVPPPPGIWKCAPPPSEPACPSARPQTFDPCVKQVQCDYGTCDLGLPLLWLCDSDRRWSGPVTRKCDP